MNTSSILWLSAVSVLLVIILIQFFNARFRSRQLLGMARTLQRISKEQSQERVTVVTGDRALRQLLIAVNRMLDDRQMSKIHYQQKEIAIRKMLANISHDLKTPLTVVLGYTETLLHEHVQKDGQHENDPRLSKLRTKTVEILDLVHLFFDLARLEAGDHELDMRKVQLNEVCKERMLSFYDLIQKEGLQADINIPEIPLFITADKKALERILDNLISNAVRYGQDGKLVGLRLYTEKDRVHIEVWDKGSGIREQEKDNIFERSYTLDDSRNKKYPGSGLGLTICKRLTEQMGGDIHVTSTPQVRTSFTLTFQLLKT